MKLLDNKLAESIYNVFDLVDNDSIKNSDKYITRCFSVFDHWLSEEEAQQQVLFYEHAIEDVGSKESKEYFLYHDKFVDFYISLFNNMKIYGFLFDERGSGRFIEFDSIIEYKSHALLSIREQLFLKIVAPEIGFIIDGGYDLTHNIYALKNHPNAFYLVLETIEKSGLFILP